MDDVKCPKCGSYETYTYNTDEIQFNYDGTGHVNYGHQCKCGHFFRSYTKFKYEVIDQKTK